jgi:hypothetical protein
MQVSLPSFCLPARFRLHAAANFIVGMHRHRPPWRYSTPRGNDALRAGLSLQAKPLTAEATCCRFATACSVFASPSFLSSFPHDETDVERTRVCAVIGYPLLDFAAQRVVAARLFRSRIRIP